MPQEFDEYGIPIKTSKGQVEEQSFDEFGIPIKKKEETPFTSGGAYVRPLSQGAGEPAQSFSKATLGRLSDEQFRAKEEAKLNRQKELENEQARIRKEQFYNNVKTEQPQQNQINYTKPLLAQTDIQSVISPPKKDISQEFLESDTERATRLYKEQKQKIATQEAIDAMKRPIDKLGIITGLPTLKEDETIPKTAYKQFLDKKEKEQELLEQKALEAGEQGRQMLEEEKLTLKDKAKSYTNSFLQGATGGLFSATRIVGMTYNKTKEFLTGQKEWESKADDYLVRKTLDNFTKNYIPENTALKEKFSSQLYRGFGQLGSMAATGLVTGGSAIVPSVSAFSESFVGEFDQAIDAGASKDNAAKVGVLNGLVDMGLEAIPVLNALKRANKYTAGNTYSQIQRLTKNAVIGGTEEAITEVAQESKSNLIAQIKYDPNRKVFEGVEESGAVGGTVGFLANIALSTLGIALKKAKTPQEKKQIEENIKELVELKTKAEAKEAKKIEPISPPMEGGAPPTTPPVGGTDITVEETLEDKKAKAGESLRNLLGKVATEEKTVTPQGKVAPTSVQLSPESQAKIDEVKSERAKILAGLDTDNNGQVIMTQEAQTKLADLKNQELKIQEDDSQNKQGVSGEVGIGQKPIEAQPVGEGGKEAIAPSGVFQTPTQEVIIPDTPAGHVTAVMDNPTADNVQNLADNAVSLAQEVIKQGNDQGTIPQEKMPTLAETTPVVEAPKVEMPKVEAPKAETPQAGSVGVGGEVKPTPQKIKVLGKDVNMYNDYIPSKIEDVELDAMYSFNANSKDGIPSLLHDIAYANKREVNGVKSENWHASISGEELIKLYPKEQSLKETPQAGSVGVGGEVELPNYGKTVDTKMGKVDLVIEPNTQSENKNSIKVSAYDADGNTLGFSSAVIDSKNKTLTVKVSQIKDKYQRNGIYSKIIDEYEVIAKDKGLKLEREVEGETKASKDFWNNREKEGAAQTKINEIAKKFKSVESELKGTIDVEEFSTRLKKRYDEINEQYGEDKANEVLDSEAKRADKIIKEHRDSIAQRLKAEYFKKNGNAPTSVRDFKSGIKSGEYKINDLPSYKDAVNAGLELPKAVEQAIQSTPQAGSVVGGDSEFTANGGNKAVDEKGEPITVYHGTGEDFEELDETKQNEATGHGDFGKGFYFSAKEGIAKYYSLKFKNRIVKKFNINVKNPFEINITNEIFDDATKKSLRGLKYLQDYEKEIILNATSGNTDFGYKKITKELGDKRFSDILKENGYDAVFVNRTLGGETTPKAEIVVFDKSQIKEQSTLNKEQSTLNKEQAKTAENKGKEANKEQKNEDKKQSLPATPQAGSVGVGGDVKQQELDAQKINKEAGVDVYVARQGVETNGEKYTLSQIKENGNTNTFVIEDANGSEIGKAQLSADGNYLENIRIDEKHRRKGLASKVYDFIELRKGIELEPSPNKQSKEAKALWYNRNLKKSVSNKANGGLLAKALGEAMSKTFADFKNKQQVLLELENKYFEQKGLSKEDFNKLNETEKAEIIKDAVKWKNNNPELVKAVEQSLKETPQAETIEDKKAKAGESLRNLLGKTGVIKNIVPSEDSDTWNDIKNIADYIAAETGKKGKELIEAIKKYLKTNGGEAIIPQIETYEKRIIAESSQEGVETTEPTNIRIFEELDAMNEKRIEKKIDFRDSISFNKKYGDKAQLAKDITNNFEKYIDKLLKEGIIVKVKC